jgi:CRISPR-associated protein Cas2
LKGELSRWLIEPAAGIFLGNPSKRVRDELWKKAISKCKAGQVVQIWSARTPCGYEYRQHGNEDRWLHDFEGLPLVMRPPKDT